MAEALSTARAMLLLMRQRRRRHAIVLQHGKPQIRALSDADEVRPSWDRPPSKLVGVYTTNAVAEDIASDIIATDQGEYATRRIR